MLSGGNGNGDHKHTASTRQLIKSWERIERSPAVDVVLQTMTNCDTGERCVQAYLGSINYENTSCRVTPMICNLYVHTLRGYLFDQEITIDGAVSIVHDLIAPPTTRVISVASGVNDRVLYEGTLFLRDREGRRAILNVYETKSGDYKISLMSQSYDAHQFFENWKQYVKEHAYLRGQRFYASGEFIKIDPPIRLNDVYLTPENRDMVERTIMRFPEQVELFRQRGMSCKRGVLLDGPPGTGKSMLCRALSCELNATFIWVTPRHVEDDSENIVEVWNLARMLQPAVILLEDIDLFAEDREDTFRSHILGELMNQMDGPENNDGILTIATTNRFDVIEKALRNRPGRFDRVIHYEMPDETGRHDLLRKYMAHDVLDDGVFQTLLDGSEGFSGARLMDLAKTLVGNAHEEQMNGCSTPSSVNITAAMARRALEEVRGEKRKRPIGFIGEPDSDTAMPRRERQREHV